MRSIALLLIFVLCPGVYGLDHRGRVYTTDGTNYMLDDGSSFRSRLDMMIAVNTVLFREITGIQSSTLEAMYIAMDVNSNAALEWSEIELFQSLLVKKYRYLTNETVLRPDDFIAQGGGDCDDWVGMTAGALRFWGYEPYVASFGRTKRIRHAVCMVLVTNAVPGNYTYYEISQWRDVPAGKYVPIDYGVVGGLSAIDGRWKIATMEVPERIYGRFY